LDSDKTIKKKFVKENGGELYGGIDLQV